MSDRDFTPNAGENDVEERNMRNLDAKEPAENVDVEKVNGDNVNAPAPVDENEPTSFFSNANLRVAQVNIVGGTLNGYSIGFVGVYTHLYGLSTNCALYKRETSCVTLSNSDCIWKTTDSAGAFCGWDGEVACSQMYPTEDTCRGDDTCRWNYSDEECQNLSGYSSLYSGIFAGAMIVGCMLGSFYSGPLAKKLGPKLSFIIIGIVGIVCSVMYHISTAVDQFWVLCISRLLIGMVLGLVCVAAPMYVAEKSHPKYSKMIGVLFQVFTTFGIFLAATMGLALGQSVQFNTESNQNIMGRMQGLCVLSSVLSVVMVFMGMLLNGFGFRDKRADVRDEDYIEGEGNATEECAVEEKQYTFAQMIGPLVMGGVVAGTLQLTGINAVMNYAPTIMGSLGLAPLVGNFVVMAWNFVTTIASIPLASIFTMRQLFLFGSLLTSAMCLFMCGVPVYPGVANSESVKNGVAITGILIFIAGFEIGVGPCFFVLAQDLFPPSFRPKGSSVTMLIQFIFNVIINVCYPIATERISGGPSGDQDKGQAVAFIFFGCVGLVCFVFQIFFLFPWDDSMDRELDEKARAEEMAEGAVQKLDEGEGRQDSSNAE